MGQYYKAIVKNDNGEKVFEPECLKLTEHSWLGNSTCQAVTHEMRKPVRVAWVGDYARDDEETHLNSALVNELYKKAWAQDRTDGSDGYDRITDYKYVIDHDRKEYFDISRYVEKSTVERYGEDECLYPVSIMTSIGNGQGGGDFFPDALSTENLIGAWAYDMLQVSNEIPNGYKEIFPVFRENH